MRYLNIIGSGLIVMAIASSLRPPGKLHKPVEQLGGYLIRESRQFAESVSQLEQTISQLDSKKPGTLAEARISLKNCRLRYKKISFFLDYFYPQAGKLYNGPAKKEVEEPYLEFEDPQGLQPIEAILYGKFPWQRKTELEELALVIRESSLDLPSLYQPFHYSEAEIMEGMHLELIRIMTLYIAGYDAPLMKTGIPESSASIQSMIEILEILSPDLNGTNAKLISTLERVNAYLRANSNFNQFNRLMFLTSYALPAEEQLITMIHSNGIELNTVRSLDYSAPNLYRRELISGKTTESKAMVKLGKSLFSENLLSGNNRRSCTTCHQPGKYFSDQLQRNKGINSHADLSRNTPSLLYASYQSAQFWDGRDSTISEQIQDVLTNKEEMNSNVDDVVRKMNNSEYYRHYFKRVFQDSISSDSVTMPEIRMALSAYVCSLSPMNSAFDRFIAGDTNAMTKQQQRGFNLFMGKAECGSCHFAPVFNGSTPPQFIKSEYEILGVPRIGINAAVLPDEDLGRYARYPVDIYRGAFKTPTVRNSAMTYPYMHNGALKTLHDVMNFYNRGGGQGLGLNVPDQTLAAHKLHLTKNEINAIVAFLKALTDARKEMDR